MNYILIRHGHTDANRMNRAAFGQQGAPLSEQGKAQAKLVCSALRKLGIDPAVETVAVSNLLRTQQTATLAGFTVITEYAALNEVNTSDPAKTLDLVAHGKVPHQAIVAAQHIISNPPTERIWITHGLVIAALQVYLGVADKSAFIPDYCEFRELIL